MSHRAAVTGAALGFAALAASLALLTLPACNECDSSIDPVKCTDLCTQNPPHRDCAQCTGDTKDDNCPQCQGANPAPGCPDFDGGAGTDGTFSGTGGGGAGGMTGGSGGTAGVVSGNGGIGGQSGAGDGGDAGPIPTECMNDDECGDLRAPRCDESNMCAGCENNEDCPTTGDRKTCDVTGAMALAGECVECLSNAGCDPESATPICVEGKCEECGDDTDCDSDIGKPECSDEYVCVRCTSAEACTSRGDNKLCDTREDDVTATEGQCVECLTHANCPDDRPQCGADGRCGPCDAANEVAVCSGKMDGDIALSRCNTHENRATTGQCVQCVDDFVTNAEDATCDSGADHFSCNRDSGRCTTTEVHSQQQCEACVADSECSDALGLRCVAYPIDGVSPTKSYCFYDEAEQSTDIDDECPSGITPFLVENATASIDGYAATYCMISTSSCEGFRDALASKPCTNDTMCGLGDEELDGARCVATTSIRCSYSCDESDQCPASQPTCSTGGVCRP